MDNAVLELEINNLKKRMSDVEVEVKGVINRVNEFDKTQVVLVTNLENIRQQLNRVEKKTDQLLDSKGFCASDEKTVKQWDKEVLDAEKARKWDKMVWIIIAEAFAIVALIVKMFMGL